MAINEKRIDRLNDLPAGKRERKGLYIAIAALFSGCISLLGYIPIQARQFDNKVALKDKEIESKTAEIKQLNIQLQACEGSKTSMERNFRGELEDQRQKIMVWMDQQLAPRERRLEKFQRLNSVTIPALLNANKQAEKNHARAAKPLTP